MNTIYTPLSFAIRPQLLQPGPEQLPLSLRGDATTPLKDISWLHQLMEWKRLYQPPKQTPLSSRLPVSTKVASLFSGRPGMGEGNSVREFGKIVPLLWSLENEEAAGLMTQWLTHPARAMENNLFVRSAEEAEHYARHFTGRGLEVRYAAIPAEILPNSKIEIGTFQQPTPQMYWVTANACSTSVPQWLEIFVKQPNSLRLHSFHETPAQFTIDVPGYKTTTLNLQSNGKGFSFSWEISTEKKSEVAAKLSGFIPNPPPQGERWIAQGEDLITRGDHVKKGLSRRSFQKVIALLYRMGVDQLNVPAKSSLMAAVCDFENEGVRHAALVSFTAYIDDKKIELSKAKMEEIQNIRHAWEILEFEDDTGSLVGRPFLASYVKQNEGISLRFCLDPNYTGWERLFQRQLTLQRAGAAAQIDPESEMETPPDIMKLLRNKMAELMKEPSLDAQSVMHDIGLRLARAVEQASRDRDHDTLTGLFNRRALFRHEPMLIQTSSINTPHYVLVVDIDHFKKVNDKHGHLMGDEVLRKIGEIANRVFRQTERRSPDIAARYGGEEFVFVFPETTLDGARRASERFMEEVKKEIFRAPSGESFQITLSGGLARFHVEKINGDPRAFNPFAEDTTHLEGPLTLAIGRADHMLYEAKEGGRDRIRFDDSIPVKPEGPASTAPAKEPRG
jgi:diguanylate cyclase (GGDEF)-like protein